MNDPHAEGPVCDFCNLAVDEGETLEPIFVGTPKEPQPHLLRATATRGGSTAPRYRGKYKALRKALYDCSDVMLEESNVVHEVTAVGGKTHHVTENELMQARSPTEFETRTSNKVGVNIKIEPKDVDHTPDAEVCDTCAEMFKSLGDE